MWESTGQAITTYAKSTDLVWLTSVTYMCWILQNIRDDDNEYIQPEEKTP